MRTNSKFYARPPLVAQVLGLHRAGNTATSFSMQARNQTDHSGSKFILVSAPRQIDLALETSLPASDRQRVVVVNKKGIGKTQANLENLAKASLV